MNKGGRKKGYMHTQETKDKISKSLKNRTVSIDTRKKTSESLKGREISTETCDRMSESSMGQPGHNKRTDGEWIDELFETYADSYESEEVGVWLNANKKVLQEADIQSTYQLYNQSKYKEVPTEADKLDFINDNATYMSPESIYLLKERLQEDNYDDNLWDL